jgi:hypothetical protein
MPRVQHGFIDPLSLLGIGFLVATIITGTVIVRNQKINMDIREKAATCMDPCQSDSDCNTDEYCYKPATGCPVCKEKGGLCTPGDTQCSGSYLQTCNANGTAWNPMICTWGCSNGACNPATEDPETPNNPSSPTPAPGATTAPQTPTPQGGGVSPTTSPTQKCFCSGSCGTACYIGSSGSTECPMNYCTTPNYGSSPCSNGMSSGQSKCISTSQIQTCYNGALTTSPCATGLACTIGDTACKPKGITGAITNLFIKSTPKPTTPFATPKTLPSTGRKNGEVCSQDSQCASNYCFTTPYGKYCGNVTTGATVCSEGARRCSTDGGIQYVQTCSNHAWVNTRRCDTGCEVTPLLGSTCSTKPICVQGETQCSPTNPNQLETCTGNGTTWSGTNCTYG